MKRAYEDYRDGRFLDQRDSGGRFYRSPSYFWDQYQCLNFPRCCDLCEHQLKACSNGGIYRVWYKKIPGGDYMLFWED